MLKDPSHPTDFAENDQEPEITDLTGDNDNSETSADAGIDTLEVLRRRIKEMEEDRKKVMEYSSPGAQKSAAVKSGPEADKCSIYVGNVDYSTTTENLQELFAACGQLERVTIICDKWTGQPKGFAYIQFASSDGVENAVLLDGSEFKGRVIKVTPKRTNVPGFSRGGSSRPRYYPSYRPRYRRSRRPRYGGGYYRPRYRNRKAVYAPYDQ